MRNNSYWLLPLLATLSTSLACSPDALPPEASRSSADSGTPKTGSSGDAAASLGGLSGRVDDSGSGGATSDETGSEIGADAGNERGTDAGSERAGCRGCPCRPSFSCDNGMVCVPPLPPSNSTEEVCSGGDWAPATGATNAALRWDEGRWR